MCTILQPVPSPKTQSRSNGKFLAPHESAHGKKQKSQNVKKRVPWPRAILLSIGMLVLSRCVLCSVLGFAPILVMARAFCGFGWKKARSMLSLCVGLQRRLPMPSFPLDIVFRKVKVLPDGGHQPSGGRKQTSGSKHPWDYKDDWWLLLRSWRSWCCPGPLPLKDILDLPSTAVAPACPGQWRQFGVLSF